MSNPLPLPHGELAQAPGLRLLRPAADLGLCLMELEQPAGELQESPTPLLSLVSPSSSGVRVRCDFGAGRFQRVLRPQDLFLSAAGHANAVQIGQAHRIRAVLLRPEPGMPSDLGVLHAGAFQSDAVSALLDRLWSSWDDTQALASRLQLEGLRLLLLSALLQRSGGSEAPLAGLAGGSLRRVLEHLHAHYAEDIRLEDLARLAGLSVFHFARSFRLAMQQTPGRYQARLRVEQAERLLRQGKLSVLEVALAVGFGSTQALARPFLARYGLSPSAYRQRWR